MADRYFESMAYVAVAAVTGYWFWSMVALTGGLITSYAKARAGLEVTVTNTEWPDALERSERGVIYLLGLGLSQWWPIRPGGHDLFYWTLVGLAVGTHATVLQRVLRAKRLIQDRSR
jgi:phosphatidylglycerophosphate synthase